ncbi:MAG: transketolase family protein [Sphaerochaetaceae bacterium]|nr:transketolase family protein [Sphaerochaetaceae bacterium]
MANKEATRFGFYEGLVELAKEHQDIYALDADLAKTTGSVAFQKAIPERYIDVGIAEQNMVGISAGLSKVGIVPFCASMAVFATGRAFEIIRNGVAYSKLNVKIVGSHGGITAAGDGGSHQCVEDIGVMRSLPNMVVLQPCDGNQARLIAKMAYEHKGPVYIRTSREPMENITSLDDKIELGKIQTLAEGKDLCIVASGMMTCLANQALEILKANGVNASLVNVHTIKPFDKDGIIREVRACGGKVLVCEESNMVCGLTEAVASSLVEEDGIKMSYVAIEDRFGQSGATAELLEAYGITKENIAAKAMELYRR